MNPSPHVRICPLCDKRQADRGRELCSRCYLCAAPEIKACDDWVKTAGIYDTPPVEQQSTVEIPTAKIRLCIALDELYEMPAYGEAA